MGLPILSYTNFIIFSNNILSPILFLAIISLYTTVENFFKALAGKGDLESSFVLSTYNSFYLRYGNPKLSKRYQLRVGIPENENTKMLWISYKLIVQGKIYIGKLQLSKNEESYIISDFEYQGLDDLFLVKDKEEK